MPTVSVIIPNFNHGIYLTQRLESVFNQTYQDLEIIILDDCSTDDSRQVLSKYHQHPKVSHVVYNEENSGSTFKQWKKGISLAQGKYVWIAESDDWCEPTLLETLISGITQDDECVISYCQSLCVNDDSKVLFQSSHHSFSELIDGLEFIKKYLSVPVAIFNASMALWRRDKFNLIPEQFLSYKFCGDWYFWIWLSMHGKVNVSAKVLNYFRKHGNDVSGKAYKSGLNFIEELDIINMLYEQRLIDEKGYYKAFRKKYLEYWPMRKQIPRENIPAIMQLFKNPKSERVSLLRFAPTAIWRSIKGKK